MEAWAVPLSVMASPRKERTHIASGLGAEGMLFGPYGQRESGLEVQKLAP